MIAEYQINVTALTVSGLTLPVDWVLAVKAVSKEDTDYKLVMQTCKAQGDPPSRDQYENITAGGVETYAYDPGTDNAKSENLMLTNTLEAELDTWFGSGNWTKL